MQPNGGGFKGSAGSVFALHAEAKDDWLKWQTDYSAKGADGESEKKPGIIGRFFHHEDKSEEEAKQEDPTPEPTHEEKKHGFMHGLFHHGD